jgi:DNA repair exonuclease SbcCD ATPase subunit
MNMKTFSQVVILGSSSYIPFMKLTTPQRREVVENLLDVGIFSVMHNILKNKKKKNSEKRKEIKSKIDVSRKFIIVEKEHYEKLKNNSVSMTDTIRKKIKNREVLITSHEERIEEIDEKINALLDKIAGHDLLDDKIIEIKSEKKATEERKKLYQKRMTFFDKNDICPTCENKITDKTRELKYAHYKNLLDDTNKEYNIYAENLNKIDQLKKRISSVLKKIDLLKNEKFIYKNKIKSLRDENYRDNAEIVQLEKESSIDLGELKEKIKKLEDSLFVLEKENEQLNKNEMIFNISNLLLKDTGIKSSIIRKYLPAINNKITTNLEKMGAYIGFSLDENFNETIQSRYLDNFEYENFSEGERKRNDLAVLFAWRALSKKKSSVDTNILVLDEVFDGSLDSEGISNLSSMISSVEKDTTTMVISHRDINEEIFDEVIRVRKDSNGFSIMTTEGKER